MGTPSPSLEASARAGEVQPLQLDLGLWPGLRLVDLSEMRRKTEKLRAGSRAPNTRRAYESDWRHFTDWCESFPASPRCLPADPATVVDYISAHAGKLAVATIRRRLSSIARQHLSAGLANPAESDVVREVLKGLRRSDRRRPAAKRAIGVAELRAMVRAVRRNESEALGVRDAALLLLGFAGGFRRSELVGLDLADVEAVKRRGVLLHVRWSKTDQVGRGRTVGVPFGQHEDTCPVRALRAWLAVRGKHDGPLFVGARGDCVLTRERLSDRAVARLVKRAAELVGLDAREFSGHSLRAGLVTSAKEAGVSDTDIMHVTGHKSVQTLARYVRPSSALNVAPVAGLL